METDRALMQSEERYRDIVARIAGRGPNGADERRDSVRLRSDRALHRLDARRIRRLRLTAISVIDYSDTDALDELRQHQMPSIMKPYIVNELLAVIASLQARR